MRESLILASSSPRRTTILTEAGFDVQVEVPDVEEEWPADVAPEAAVQQIALTKALAVAPNFFDRLVLAADTAVVHKGRVMGKPRLQGVRQGDALDALRGNA